MLTGPKKTGRVAKWAIELGEHDIVFLKRNEKETLADFLVEIPFEDNKKKEKPKEEPDSSSKWRLYTDGASNSDGSGAGLMLIDPKGKEYTYALRFEFETTNNEAEYEALLAGLRIAQEMEIAKVAIFLDSQLLEPEQESRRAKQAGINDLRTSHKGSASRSFDQKKTQRKLGKSESRRHNKLIRGNLYKRSFFTPWLRCVAPPQTDKIIKEIHEGSCGFNAEPRSLVVRITKQGYYWPSMHREVAKAIQDCEKCKEQSAIRKAGTSGAIAAGST
ncbi:reverse transcriptase domain-containing protein [Tanacetum coccineum]